jgi:hypothetical protein
MNEFDDFLKFLKKNGKKPNRIEYFLDEITRFAEFLRKTSNLQFHAAKPENLDQYAATRKNCKMPMYALMNYYKFVGNDEMYKRAASIRRELIDKKKKPFQIKDFLGIQPDHIKKLAEIKIQNVEQMLKEGKTPEKRRNLAKKQTYLKI